MRIAMVGSALSLMAAGAAAADAAAVSFAGSNQTMSGNCGGHDASLAGSGNTVTLRGACRFFQLAGDDNRVYVEMAANGTIKVLGKRNQVSWTGPGDVQVTALGPDNVVLRAK